MHTLSEAKYFFQFRCGGEYIWEYIHFLKEIFFSVFIHDTARPNIKQGLVKMMPSKARLKFC